MKQGDRIRLLSMDDQDALPRGATGTIESIDDMSRLTRSRSVQIWVKWDAPHEARSLAVIVPPDQIEVIE